MAKKSRKTIKRMTRKLKQQHTEEQVSEKVRLALSAPKVMIAIGASLFLLAAAVAIQQVSQPRAPEVRLLPAGTHAPAQVIFQVKKGVDPLKVFQGVVDKGQTVYQDQQTKRVYELTDSQVKNNPGRFHQAKRHLTVKKIRPLFVGGKLTSDVRKKIQQRSGASDPIEEIKNKGLDRWYVAEVRETQANVALLIANLESNPDVQAASPNSQVDVAALPVAQTTNNPGAVTTAAPNDEFYSSQWGLAAIKAEGAWTLGTGNPNVMIAVIDTGVDWDHPDLLGRFPVNAGEDINHNGCADYWPTSELRKDCRGQFVNGDLNGDTLSADDDGNGYANDLNGMNFYDIEDGKINDPAGPYDDVGHGTAVAGLIGATTNNQKGISGVCGGCSLLAVKSGDESMYMADMIRGLEYSIIRGADVIYLTPISGNTSSNENTLLRTATDLVMAAKVAIVTAAGNENQPIDQIRTVIGGELIATSAYYPSSWESVITVGAAKQPYATTANDRWLGTRDVDGRPVEGSNYGYMLDVLAPGELIIFPSIRYKAIDPPAVPEITDYYYGGSGTTLAAAHVAGTIGLMLSANPRLDPDLIETILEETATVIPNFSDERRQSTGGGRPNQYVGYGLLNAEAAVQLAKIMRPDFSLAPEAATIVQVGSTDYRFDASVDNIGRLAAQNVRYELQQAMTGAVLYGSTIEAVRPPGTRVTETIRTLAPLPASVKLVIDPQNAYDETLETNNSVLVAVPPYGTPYFVDVQSAVARITQLFTLEVVAKTPTNVAVIYEAVSLPAGATLSGNIISWTPSSSLLNTSTTMKIRAKNSLNPALQVTVTIPVTVKPPLSGPYYPAVPSQSFAAAVKNGKLVIGGPEFCAFSSTGILPDEDKYRCAFSASYVLTNQGIHLDDVQYIRVRFNSKGKWDAPISGSYQGVDDGVRARSTGPGQYLFDLYPRPGSDTDIKAGSAGAHWSGTLPFLSTLRFVERDDEGDRFGSANILSIYNGWPRSWSDWLTGCNNKADGAQDKNGLGVRAWSTGTNIVSGTPHILTGLTFCLIDDSGGSISPWWSAEIHLKSLNQVPVFSALSDRTADENTLITFPVSATDPNGDLDLVYFASGLPAGATFNSSTRTFSWTPTYSQSGIYDVTLTASDGSPGGTETVRITVQNPPPKLNTMGNVSMRTGQRLTFNLLTVDPSPDPLTYSATGLPPGATLVGKTFTFVPHETLGGSSYTTTFKVTGARGIDAKTIKIVVGEGEGGGGGAAPIGGLKKLPLE